jgi:hypothetical protein
MIGIFLALNSLPKDFANPITTKKCHTKLTIDSATKYCQGAPSISAFFAEMGGNRCHCFLAGSIMEPIESRASLARLLLMLPSTCSVLEKEYGCKR